MEKEIYERLTALETSIHQYFKAAEDLHKDHEQRLRRAEKYGLAIMAVLFSTVTFGTDALATLLSIFKVL